MTTPFTAPRQRHPKQGPDGSLYRTMALAIVLLLSVRLSSVHASATAPTLVHSFNGYSEGAYPRTALVPAADGTF